MNRRALYTLGASLCLLGTSTLHAQDRRLSERFPAAIASRIGFAIDSAHKDGLPTEPLVLRALEGGAKNAPPERILAVLHQLHDALLSARRIVGPKANATELTTAAAALQGGVTLARLTELHELRAGRTVTAPLGAYLDLVARGASPERTWTRITDLCRHQASDAEFTRLSPSDVDHGAPSGADR